MALASFVPISLVRFTTVVAPDYLSAAENGAAKKNADGSGRKCQPQTETHRSMEP